jgi:hypothetical protein
MYSKLLDICRLRLKTIAVRQGEQTGDTGWRGPGVMAGDNVDEFRYSGLG